MMKRLLLILFVLGFSGQSWGQQNQGIEYTVGKSIKRFVYQGRDSHIIQSVNLANKIIDQSLLLVEISNVSDFENAKPSLNGEKLAKMISNFSWEVYIDTYKPCWRWTSANAYTIEEKPTIIYLNKWKIKKLDAKTLAATIIHEYVHLVDFENHEHEFTHRGNKRKGNENTAPYVVEHITSKILENF